jgi:cell division protein FtsI/penicillin-binding protein 2
MLDVASGRITAQWNLKVAARRVTAPGSAAKPFVLLALLQSGKVDARQRVACRRPLTIAGRHMDCSHSPAVSNLDASDAIAYSCNSYFATVSRRLSPQELYNVFERAGFTSRTGLSPDEAVGQISPANDEAHLQLQALGEWGIEVTPLELLAAYRKVALLKRNNNSFAAPVFAGLERSVQYGMAHDAQPPTDLTVAGKTGTAAGRQMPQTHGFFVGYAPAEKPEIVLMVYLEQGRGSDAAAIAAPIFAAYSKKAQGGRNNGAAR